METIIKYDNRKLYSKTLGKYVRQDYILDLVKTGQKFKVERYGKGDITDKAIKASLSKLTITTEDARELIRRLW